MKARFPWFYFQNYQILRKPRIDLVKLNNPRRIVAIPTAIFNHFASIFFVVNAASGAERKAPMTKIGANPSSPTETMPVAL